MTALQSLRYSQKIGKDFSTTLNKRVRDYFKEHGIHRYANASMKLKTVFMISLFFVPLFFLLSTWITSVWLVGLMYALMGLGTAGIGLSIMHDANHGAYSPKGNVNKWLGKIIALVGGYAPTWKIQHNILHHTYTNVEGYDEDINPPPFLRFSPNAKWRPIHRFQHFYAWFFYGLMTISWSTTKDFNQLFRYKKMGLTRTENPAFGKLLFELIFSKLLYYTLVLVLPIALLDISWWWFPIFFFLLHFLAGTILSFIFQTAHVVPETSFVAVETDKSYIENNFAIHQLQTTANFAPRSAVLHWLIGGLNYQIEHHLFPNICHVHYKKISAIVRKTAEEFSIPYHTHSTFFHAIYHHFRMLKLIGRSEVLAK